MNNEPRMLPCPVCLATLLDWGTCFIDEVCCDACAESGRAEPRTVIDWRSGTINTLAAMALTYLEQAHAVCDEDLIREAEALCERMGLIDIVVEVGNDYPEQVSSYYEPAHSDVEAWMYAGDIDGSADVGVPL